MKPVKYSVEISPVREVTLVGNADLDFWQSRLASHGFYAMNDDGQAQLILCAVDSQFMGLRFRELSISVAVTRREFGTSLDGVFLTHAFNSRRFFAFVERARFHTPYFPADLRVEVQIPVVFAASRAGRTLLAARMAGNEDSSNVDFDVTHARDRRPTRRESSDWRVPIFLPDHRSTRPDERRLFFGRLAGDMAVYEFDSAADSFVVSPVDDTRVLQWLIDSQFVGREWRLRSHGTHGKSKTVRLNVDTAFSAV